MPASQKGDLIADLQAENQDLRSQLDTIRNRSLDTWLGVVSNSGVAVRDFENSVSWRLTRPLRTVRRVQVAIRDVGIGAVASAALRRLRMRLRSP